MQKLVRVISAEAGIKLGSVMFVAKESNAFYWFRGNETAEPNQYGQAYKKEWFEVVEGNGGDDLIPEIQARIDATEESITVLKGEIATLKTEVDSLNEKLLSMEETLNALGPNVEAIKNNQEEFQNTFTTVQEDINNQLMAMQASIDELKGSK